jgi:hypothetical protein
MYPKGVSTKKKKVSKKMIASNIDQLVATLENTSQIINNGEKSPHKVPCDDKKPDLEKIINVSHIDQLVATLETTSQIINNDERSFLKTPCDDNKPDPEKTINVSNIDQLNSGKPTMNLDETKPDFTIKSEELNDQTIKDPIFKYKYIDEKTSSIIEKVINLKEKCKVGRLKGQNKPMVDNMIFHRHLSFDHAFIYYDESTKQVNFKCIFHFSCIKRYLFLVYASKTI